MARNEILPSGSMDVGDLIEEIMIIRKKNATPEEAKRISLETILSTSHKEWEKICENDGMKKNINMIAVRKMEEVLKNTLLVDPDGDNDLEKLASDQITSLTTNIQETIETEVKLSYVNINLFC
jgi:hypothetical protein